METKIENSVAAPAMTNTENNHGFYVRLTEYQCLVSLLKSLYADKILQTDEYEICLKTLSKSYDIPLDFA